MSGKSTDKKMKKADNSSESIFKIHQTNVVFVSIILFFSLAVYSNALFNDFVYDDKSQVLENPWIKDIKNISDIFTTSVVSFKGKSVVSNYYRPLMHVIYIFNYNIFGLKPWGFHLINMLFHAGISVLVFILTKRLLSLASQASAASVPAFMAGLLFATHPIHTEAVAWVAAIPELSYTFFFLLSFYFYLRHKEGFKTGYLLSVISFALAALCKEPALTLPVFLIAYDAFSKKEKDRLPDALRRYIPYIIVSVCYLLLRSYALGGFLPQEPHIKLTNYEYFINIFPLFSQYLWKLLLPVNLNAFYVLHPISSIFQLKGVLGLCITAAFVVMAVVALRKNKTIFLGLLFIAVPLLPVLYIPALGENVFTERYLYLPSFGFVLLLAVLFSSVKENQSNFSILILKIITVFLVGLYSFGTISRNAIWKNDLILFSDAVKKSPDAALPHNSLGIAYGKQGRIVEAMNEFQTALKLKPSYAEAHTNLGVVYAKQGRTNEAINEYLMALSLYPEDVNALFNLANDYADQGQNDEAINAYITAIKLNPNDVKIYNNLGIVYADEGRIDEAINSFKTVLDIDPDFIQARTNLGIAYAKLGRINEAVNEFKTVLNHNPDDIKARQHLDLLLTK